MAEKSFSLCFFFVSIFPSFLYSVCYPAGWHFMGFSGDLGGRQSDTRKEVLCMRNVRTMKGRNKWCCSHWAGRYCARQWISRHTRLFVRIEMIRSPIVDYRDNLLENKMVVVRIYIVRVHRFGHGFDIDAASNIEWRRRCRTVHATSHSVCRFIILALKIHADPSEVNFSCSNVCGGTPSPTCTST